MKEENGLPETLQEALVYFADQQTAHDFLVSLRWPNGVKCPRCHSKELSFVSTRRIWKCKKCKKNFSVKVGTVLEDSPIGLDKWLAGFWLIVNAKNGISSYELHRALGVTQKSAWFMLHRIRLAMQSNSFTKMGGPGSEVEVDETFIGGKARNMHKSKKLGKGYRHRGIINKTVVMGMLERGGRVTTRVIKERSVETLQGNVCSIVEDGASVYTDEW